MFFSGLMCEEGPLARHWKPGCEQHRKWWWQEEAKGGPACCTGECQRLGLLPPRLTQRQGQGRAGVSLTAHLEPTWWERQGSAISTTPIFILSSNTNENTHQMKTLTEASRGVATRNQRSAFRRLSRGWAQGWMEQREGEGNVRPCGAYAFQPLRINQAPTMSQVLF